MKRKLIAILLLLALLLSLAGCNQKKEINVNVKVDQNKTKDIKACEITFWHAMTDAQKTALEKLVDQFNKENPYGIKVNLVGYSKYNDLKSQLASSVKDGTAPDISQIYNNWVVDYADKLVTLDDFIENDFDNPEDLVQAFADECKDFGVYKSLPFNKSTYVYVYNKTLFEQLSLKVPETWSDVETIAAKIKRLKEIPTIGFQDLAGSVEALILQNGGSRNSDGSLTLTDDASVAALDWVMKMYKDGYASLQGDYDYFSDMFSAGYIASYIGSSSSFAFIETKGWEYAAAPMFVVENGQKVAVQAGTNIAMLSTDDNKRLASWEFMKYLTSTEATTQWAISTGYLPVRLSAFETAEYKEYLDSSIIAQAAYTHLKDYKGVFTGVYKGATSFRTDMGDIIESAINQGTSTEELVKQLVSSSNKARGVE